MPITSTVNQKKSLKHCKPSALTTTRSSKVLQLTDIEHPDSAGVAAISGALTYGKFKFIREYKFLPDRNFRFDFVLLPLERKIAIEYEGGSFGGGKPCPVCKRQSGGRHNSVRGFINDVVKYRLACINGWRVLRYTEQDIENNKAYLIPEDLIKMIQNGAERKRFNDHHEE